MIKNFALTLIFTLFVSSSLYAACSKKEIVQFVELGFTKKEIKQICEDDSIDFGKDPSEANEVEEADEETSENKESVNDRNDEVESIRTDPESPQETLQQARQSTKQGRSQIFFEIGGMNGKYSMKSSDEIVREYSGDLDHDLSGAMFSLGYQYKFDSNMLVGLGYQSFNLEGESKEVSKTFFSGGLYFPDFRLKARVDELKGSGLFGVVGYEGRISNSVEIVPQIRLGISNEITVTRTFLLSGINGSSSVKGEEKATVTPVGIALPIIYRFGAFGLGFTVYGMVAGFEYEEDSTKENVQTTAGGMIFLGNKF